MTHSAHHARTGATTSAGVSIHYTIEGAARAPVLHGHVEIRWGSTLQMWDPQMPSLLKHFRVLRYDTRGHGRSSVSGQPFGACRRAGHRCARRDGPCGRCARAVLPACRWAA
ncbi:hypothetical protein ACTMU2_40315 [Cupriavidus basilensis]